MIFSHYFIIDYSRKFFFGEFDLIMIYSVVKLIHITQGIMFSHEGQTGDKQKIIT